MNIQDIIESIANIGKVVMVHLTKETYSILDGNLLSMVNEVTQIYYGKDDSIAALFDADLFGWQVKGVDWCSSSEGTPLMDLEITLFRYQ